MNTVPNFRSPRRLAEFVTQNGSYFFTPGAMAFFDSRIEDYLSTREDGVRLMVVSNQYHPLDPADEDGTREYAVVEVEPRWGMSRVDYASDDRYETFAEAREAAEANR